MSSGEHSSPEGEAYAAKETGHGERQDPKPLSLEVAEGDSHFADLARKLEAEVLEEIFGNTPEQIREEYGKYEDASTFLILYDKKADRAAGMFRLIHNSPVGLKTFNDIEDPKYPWHASVDEILARNQLALDKDKILDIGTVTIAPEYRGNREARDVTYGLYRGLYTYSRAQDCEAWIGILDDGVLAYTQSEMGGPFKTFDGLGSAAYIDSPGSTPIYAILADLPEIVSQARDQNFYRKCLLGEDVPLVEIPEELDRIRP